MNFKEFMDPSINEGKKYLYVSTDVVDVWSDELNHDDHAYIELSKSNVIKKGKYEITEENEEDGYFSVKFPEGESEMVYDDIKQYSHIFKIK